MTSASLSPPATSFVKKHDCAPTARNQPAGQTRLRAEVGGEICIKRGEIKKDLAEMYPPGGTTKSGDQYCDTTLTWNERVEF